MEGMYLNIIKSIYDKPIDYGFVINRFYYILNILNDEKNVFSLSSE